MLFTIIEEAEHTFVSLLADKLLLLGIQILFDAKQLSGQAHQQAHILDRTLTTDKLGAVIAQVVVVQTLHLFAIRLGVAVNHALVALVSDVLADAILIVGAENASTLAAIFRIKLHHSMKRCTTTGEEVKNSYSWNKIDKKFNKC